MINRWMGLALLGWISIGPAAAAEWTYGHAERDGFRFELAFFTNASGKLSENGTGFTHDPPLIIHSTARYTGVPTFLHCEKGFLQFGKGCFECPTGFNNNFLEAPASQRKCVKFYNPVTAYDSVYDRALVEAAGFTKRQVRCILDTEACYSGIIGAMLGERYGMACGWKFGSEATSRNLLDNVDKCCKAHDAKYWKDNMNSGTDSKCANDLNMLRCVYKVAADSAKYATKQGQVAAQWLVDAFNIPTGALCQSDYRTNDGGAYPWSASDCDDPAKCYSHIFEAKDWVDQPDKNATWCKDATKKPPTCTASK